MKEDIKAILDAQASEPTEPGKYARELASVELRSMLNIEMVSRCVNAAEEWHVRVYTRDKGARQSLMAAVCKAGMQGLENVMLKESAFASYLARLARSPSPSGEGIKEIAERIASMSNEDGDNGEHRLAAQDILALLSSPSSGAAETDIGVCSSCHAVLDAGQIEAYGGHVVAVADQDGYPTPEPCSPVTRYRVAPEPAESPSGAGEGK